ncbi:Hsp70 family protein, partial [Candidatus Sumerlaeota bacterium]|nr:Hsp70 family protein [Candidatus Sumerlaeota bacterium]
LLLDVTPLSLGIELAGNLFSPIIPRNSNVPTTVSKKFTTVVDNQTTVNVHVLQGERKIARENRTLGNFKLTGIPPAPKEIPEIEVGFHIDANGILTVTAMDLTSGVSQQVEIESYVPSGTEVTTMMEDSEKNLERERMFVQKAEVRKRLHVIENEFKALAARKEAKELINDETAARIREVIFKWEISLAQDNWEIIDEAERNAKALYIELASTLALGHKTQPLIAHVDDPKVGLEEALKSQLAPSSPAPPPARRGI